VLDAPPCALEELDAPPVLPALPDDEGLSCPSDIGLQPIAAAGTTTLATRARTDDACFMFELCVMFDLLFKKSPHSWPAPPDFVITSSGRTREHAW
jgi:hypothetical protein